MKDQISSGEDTQGLVPAPWEMFENALDRKERRGKSFIWYSIAAGVLLVFSAVIAWLGVANKSIKGSEPVAANTSSQVDQPKASEQVGGVQESKRLQEIEPVQESDILQETETVEELETVQKSKITQKSEDIKTQESANVSKQAAGAQVDKSTEPKEIVTKAVASEKLAMEPTPTMESVVTPTAAPQSSSVAVNRKSTESAFPALEVLLSSPVSENQISNNSGIAWMLDAAGFELQAVEFVSDFTLAQMDLAKLNKEFESSEISKGSLSDLAHAMDLGKWWMEVSADQNQTGLTYRTPSDLSQYVHKNYTQQMRNGETALSAARFQLAVNMFIAKNSSVKVGLAYAQNKVGQSFNFRDSMPAVVSAGQTPDANGNYPIFGYLGLGPEVKYNGVINYSFLSVPIGWTGYFPIGKSKNLFFTPEALLQPNWIQLSTGAQTLDYQTLLLKPMDAVNYRAWVMSARVAAGIQKRLNYKHAIGAKLNAQGVLNSMNTANSPVQTRGWSSGVTLYYSFKID